MQAMEALMLREPGNWNRHYPAEAEDARFLRHYSLSDRIRYYWPAPEAQAAVARLMRALRGVSVPVSLFWQHLPEAAPLAGAPLDPEEAVIRRIRRSLAEYRRACG